MDTKEIRAGDLTGGTVLVIHLPVGKGDADLREMRDYVAESIDKGVLVLNANTAYKLERFPPLGGVLVCTGGMEAGSGRPSPGALLRERDVPQLSAQAEGEEKRRILQRLKEYRAANGPGCLEEVSQRTRTRGGVLSVMTLRDVLNGDAVLPVQDWRRIGRALDKLAPPEVPPGE